MQLKDFFDYKNQLMRDLLTDPEMVDLIEPGTTVENAKKLAYTQVYPFEFVPETIQSGKTYVLFDCDLQASPGSLVAYPILYVWTLAHESMLRLPDGKGVRTDAICNRLCELIDGSLYYGLGKMELYSVRRFAPVTGYNGKQVTFHLKEFKRVYDGKKRVPANRKVENGK